MPVAKILFFPFRFGDLTHKTRSNILVQCNRRPFNNKIWLIPTSNYVHVTQCIKLFSSVNYYRSVSVKTSEEFSYKCNRLYSTTESNNGDCLINQLSWFKHFYSAHKSWVWLLWLLTRAIVRWFCCTALFTACSGASFYSVMIFYGLRYIKKGLIDKIYGINESITWCVLNL